ncbi:MAG: hypothetical protein RJB43_882 [Verrucomicrobiota bacterium]|jgi:dTDP-4-dehydrorhamnose 3,5-epimerase-like enzyme|nr:cupin domain-containing protein [Verrucomicrobiota bacterium]
MITEKISRHPRRLVADERGAFIKCIDGLETHLPAFTGEVYVVRAQPGRRRGDHYHPQAREWFTVVAGAGVLVLRDISTNERLELALTAEQPETVMVPPGIAHVFVNSAQAKTELIVVAYTDRLYDPADTVACKVD